MLTRRTKRSTRAAIIEISDSDESPPRKKTKTRSECGAAYDKAGRQAAGIESTHNHSKKWPTKDKAQGQQASMQSGNNVDSENIPSNSATNNNLDCNDASEGIANDSLPLNSGRSSFWGRRKVWNVYELLAETTHIDDNAAKNIVNLLENENTIPFICRYRRDLINHMTPDKLRGIKNAYTEIVNLRKKAEAIVTHLEKEQNIDPETRNEMMCAKTAEELEFLYAPYKPASKGSLAERAKALGLDVYAERILNGERPPVRLEDIVNPTVSDLDNVEKVMTGICHIISHTFSKHTGVLEELRRLQKIHRIFLKSSKIKESKTALSKTSTSKTSQHNSKNNDTSKFELYFDFQCDVNNLKPHQILALNRGESLKILKIKLITNDYLKNDVKQYIRQVFLSEGIQYEVRSNIFEKAFEECYTKKIQPLLSRQIRSDLNAFAKEASIDVFAKNLKQLLLMSPLKGERILGIDPGFVNGCKLALISETGDVLETGVIYPHKREADPEACGAKLAKMLARHKCNIIALGNGTACRETEFWLAKLFEFQILDPNLVRYSIVSEQGASIYSCSQVAQKEFPDMDMNVISAVSIARRLNDPLNEYVKIEPRHIGVGMYQHDINEKALTESLNEVVSECVSFVGVDINTAGLTILKHIAGLTEKKAEKIIQHRAEQGLFRTRNDLMKVKSVGAKTFTQCAGFIRIEPCSVGGTVDNLLDCTWVHPESYKIAEKIISKCKLRLSDIGKPSFISQISDYVQRTDIQELATTLRTPQERLEVVLEALQRELSQDYRSDFKKPPLFKQGITRLADLSEGDVATGAVTNVTHFGAFIDIGVECNGLLHISQMKKANLNIGDRVTVSIIQVDVKRKRVSLRLEDMLMETDTSFTFA